MTICAAIRSFWLTAALLILADALTTWYALQLGLAEGNPLAVWSMSRIGIAPDLILKVLITVPLVWSLAVTSDWGIRHGKMIFRNAGIIGLTVTIMFMSAIVTNNVTLILLRQGGTI